MPKKVFASGAVLRR